MQRSRISSSDIVRALMPFFARKSARIFSVTGEGFAFRLLLDPADVEAGEIAHRERPHREPEIVEHLVDSPGRCAFQHQLLRLALALRQDAVADEAGCDAHK